MLDVRACAWMPTTSRALCGALETFVVGELSNWYIPPQSRALLEGARADKVAAFRDASSLAPRPSRCCAPSRRSSRRCCTSASRAGPRIRARGSVCRSLTRGSSTRSSRTTCAWSCGSSKWGARSVSARISRSSPAAALDPRAFVGRTEPRVATPAVRGAAGARRLNIETFGCLGADDGRLLPPARESELPRAPAKDRRDDADAAAVEALDPESVASLRCRRR